MSAISEHSNAFESGGHHYTLLAIYRANRASLATADQLKLVEAFCAQLPDMSVELDAFTQEKKVLGSWGLVTWVLFNRCMSPRDRHMVLSQYYLHALTGTDTSPVRNAAERLLRELQVAIDNEHDSQQKMNLVCERGFAAHLLADTYAHSRLDDPDRLYSTGFGHGRELSKPDYVFTRRDMAPNVGGKNSWLEWARKASDVIDQKPLDSSVVAEEAKLAGKLAVNGKIDAKAGEPEFVSAFRTFATSQWSPYKTPLEDWPKPPNSVWSVLPTITVTCQQQVDGGPINMKGTGLVQVAGVRPQCDIVWRDYLERANRQFSRQKVSVGDNSTFGSECRPNRNDLKDGL